MRVGAVLPLAVRPYTVTELPWRFPTTSLVVHGVQHKGNWVAQSGRGPRERPVRGDVAAGRSLIHRDGVAVRDEQLGRLDGAGGDGNTGNDT